MKKPVSWTVYWLLFAASFAAAVGLALLAMHFAFEYVKGLA